MGDGQLQRENVMEKKWSSREKRGLHESEKEGSGTHVAQTAPPLVFFPSCSAL